MIQATPRRRTALSAALLAVGLCGAPAQAAVTFAITVLPWSAPLVFGYPMQVAGAATAINDQGLVVGNHIVGANSTARAWYQGQTVDPFGGAPGGLQGVDAIGQMYGWMQGTLGSRLAVVTDGLTNRTIPQAGGLATAVGGLPDGTVVGNLVRADGSSAAFRLEADGRYRDQKISALNTTARGINGAGSMVGDSEQFGDGTAIVWNAVGPPSDLASSFPPGGQPLRSGAAAINSAGGAVGESYYAQAATSAAIFQGGQLALLGTLWPHTLESSRALAINDLGQIVGESTNGATLRHAFISTGAGSMRDLNNYTAGQPTVVAQANGINIHGQIAATSDTGQALLLTPQGSLAWTRTGGGRFGDIASWDSDMGFGPNRFLTLSIAPAASQTVTFDADATVQVLDVGTLHGGQVQFQMSQGASLTTAGGFILRAGSTLGGDGHVRGGDLISYGTVLAAPGAALWVDSRFQNHGLVTGNGALHGGAFVNEADGTVQPGSGQRLLLASTQPSNLGVIELRNGAVLQTTGALVNQATGVLRLDGGELRADGSLQNQGRVNISFGGASVSGRVVNAASGQITASGGGHVTFWDALTNDGSIMAGAGAQIVYFGYVDGHGGFVTQGAGAYHRFEGGFAPGLAGAAAVTLGDAQIASRLTLDIGGTMGGSDYDQISFSGAVEFDPGAALEVDLLAGFTPQAGQRFQLLHFAQAASGQLDALQLPPLPAGLAWDSSRLLIDGELAVQAVPEPAGRALWLAGLSSLFFIARRRRALALVSHP